MAKLETLSLIPALVLVGAIVLPSPASPYAFLGGDLNLDQRGFRIFDNFTDPEASTNQALDPLFPGARGAELAIWKAASEWGSETRCHGHSDPHQPGDLGSGGANFDLSYQGPAFGVGNTNGNTHSELFAPGNGVLAFTELPISDGWRIRYFSLPWIWHDSPIPATGLGPDHVDLQGVATHEIGHSLGLDHSTIPGSTMEAGAVFNTHELRSIEADDIAGIQALYGVRSSTKPRIEALEVQVGQVTLFGTGFAPTDNQVWFTQRYPASITPLRIGPVSSTAGGTRLVVQIPAGSGAGELLVQRPGLAHSDLSNAQPFDPSVLGCPPPIRFGPQVPNSIGIPARLDTTGSTSLSAGSLTFHCAAGTPGALGVLFNGTTPGALPFRGATLLIAPTQVRIATFAFDAQGSISIPLPASAQAAGTTRLYQLWFQDPGFPGGVSVTDGLQVTLCP